MHIELLFLIIVQLLLEKLFADYAYDAEFVHEKCFGIKVQTIIKPKKNVKRGFYRRKQMKNYSEKIYHWLSLIESGFGSLKRKYGSSVSGKSWKSVNSEIYCKAISHNLNLTPSWDFQQSQNFTNIYKYSFPKNKVRKISVNYYHVHIHFGIIESIFLSLLSKQIN